jgi:adenosylmethionine-8-amino-7-oxononanoate aminotransferase
MMKQRLTIQKFISPHNAPDFPLAVRGEGVFIHDASGRKILDGSSGAVVSALGHGNRRVIDAMRSQLDAITFAYARTWETRPDQALVEKLSRLCGGTFDAAYFVNGGSEATETALKFVRQLAIARGQPERWKVIGRLPSYHGATLGALSVTGDPVMSQLFGPLMALMPKVPSPLIYRLAEGWDADSYIDHCAEALATTIQAEGPASVLAFIMEPVGGTSTGALVSPERYYRRIREICDEFGIFLIFDEIMSGVGRCGRFLASHYWEGVAADVVTLGKGLGAGYMPISALVTSSALVDELRTMGGFAHGHTYVANPLGCAVGCAVLDEVVEQNLVARSAETGAYLKSRLENLRARVRSVGDVRGCGLQLAVEIVADPETRTPYPYELNAPAQIDRLMMARELAMMHRRTGGGQFGEWFMVCPPLISTREEIDLLVGRFEEALVAFERQNDTFRSEAGGRRG